MKTVNFSKQISLLLLWGGIGLLMACSTKEEVGILPLTEGGKSLNATTLGQVYTVSNANELSVLSLAPGDKVVMMAGNWHDQVIKFKGQGTEQSPIILVTQVPGQIISGRSTLEIDGTWLIVDGLFFTNGYASDGKNVIEFSRTSSNCRLTNTSIQDYNHPQDSTKWVSMFGDHNRVDHCSFTGKTKVGTTLVVWLDSVPDYHLIDHNYFGPRPSLNGANGGESVRIGSGELSPTASSNSKVSFNIFEECDGEGETISLKSSHNIISNNFLYKSQGTITCRQGHYNEISNNYFIGNDKADCGGIRLTGENHIVKRNYFQHLKGRSLRAAISVMNGEVSPTYSGYRQVKNAVIQNNVLVNCRETFYLGSAPSTTRVLAPDGLNVSKNFVINPTSLMITNENNLPTNSVIVNNQLYGQMVIPGFITMIKADMIKASGIWQIKAEQKIPFWLNVPVGPSWQTGIKVYPLQSTIDSLTI